jgi:G:T-mismatch repair DNA endonuclease (very short patch repair protein)
MLHGLGWKTLTVWECQLKRVPQLTARIRRFLEK